MQGRIWYHISRLAWVFNKTLVKVIDKILDRLTDRGLYLIEGLMIVGIALLAVWMKGV